MIIIKKIRNQKAMNHLIQIVTKNISVQIKQNRISKIAQEFKIIIFKEIQAPPKSTRTQFQV